MKTKKHYIKTCKCSVYMYVACKNIITLNHKPGVWSPACVWFWRSCSWSWSPGWMEAAEELRWQKGRAEAGPFHRFPAVGSVHEETSVGPGCSTPDEKIKQMTFENTWYLINTQWHITKVLFHTGFTLRTLSGGKRAKQDVVKTLQG